LAAQLPKLTFGAYFKGTPVLQPGDSLTLLDGNYAPGTTGLPSINCTTNANNGTASRPITIRSMHERAAHLVSDGGQQGFEMQHCSYYNLDGLYASSMDKDIGTSTWLGNAVRLSVVSNIKVTRLLATNNNRYSNVAVVSIEDSSNVLVEESEVYGNQRHGFLVWLSRYVTLRRDYVNSLQRGCSPTTPQCPGNRVYGDSGISIYGSSDSIIENCVTENWAGGITINGVDNALDPSGHGGRRNRILGTIMANDYGIQLASRGAPTYSSTYANAEDNVIRDVAIASSQDVGIYLLSAARNLVDNVTVVGMANSGISAYDTASLGATCDVAINTDGCGFTATNVLSINNTVYGFNQANQQSPLLRNSNMVGNAGGNFLPAETINDSSGWIQNSQSTALTGTGIGLAANQCIAWVPDLSNMKRAGLNSADIGANIIYRYQDAALTGTPLWDSSTGAFPCGAVVTGVNDGTSRCSNVQTRLNINQNGCALPIGVGPTPTPSATPVATPTPSPVPTGAIGSTYYIKPGGNDLLDGKSIGNAWGTFGKPFSVAKILQPGDSLTLLDGTYTLGNTGLPDINCAVPGGNANNGSSSLPISIKAANERKAFLKSDGSVNAFKVANCSYYTIEGLRAESRDNASVINSSLNNVFYFLSDFHLNIRRNIAAYPNRNGNSHTFTVEFCGNSLLEENEAYYASRHSFSIDTSEYITVRRNYANPRGYPQIYQGAHEGIVFYDSSNCTSENNVLERTDGYEVHAGYNDYAGNPGGQNNLFQGDVSFHDSFGGGPDGRNNAARSNVYRNFAIIQGGANEMRTRSAQATLMENLTVIGGQGNGFLGTDNSGSYVTCAQIPSPFCTFTIRNSLFFGNAGFGVSTVAPPPGLGLIENSNFFNNGLGPVSPVEPINDATGIVQNSMLVSPTGVGFGTGLCSLWIPASSPMKGTGKAGADIGANILYRYQDGIPTGERLWDPTTGAFPCGATVNDSSDASYPLVTNDATGASGMAAEACGNIHVRLNVNRNGCLFPAGY
jgi:hypothetical protein